MEKKFDIIIAGAGLAGLTLACELARRPAFLGKKIGLIDRSEKQLNDRTWCSWATSAELATLLQTGVKPFKSWDEIAFHGSRLLNSSIPRYLKIFPYKYHVVRGIDFYENARKQLAKNPNIEWIFAEIEFIDAQNGRVKTDLGEFSGDQIFNSFFEIEKLDLPANSTNLLQHFKGYLIETPAPFFDPAAMTFMDFRIDQADETRFVYVLPISETRALVEFTVFGERLLDATIYDRELSNYLHNLLKIPSNPAGKNEFEILETEFGIIPMTDFSFQKKEILSKNQVIEIGTKAGFVKASSGYAFKRTQEKIRALVDFYEKTGRWEPGVMRSKWIFRVFDSIFLEVLRSRRAGGADIFSAMFSNLPAPLVFKFLDEKTGFFETIRVLFSCPIWPFFRSMLAVLPRFFRV